MKPTNSICEDCGIHFRATDNQTVCKKCFRGEAPLTVEQLAQLAARHGLALVPLVPTDEMILAALEREDTLSLYPSIYKAMIEAGKVK